MIENKKVVSFICECNPFHEGHKRLINEAKNEGDILVAIMSGNFVQRGEPAVYDKYLRAKDLIKNGVDVVIELPVEYCLSSARYFAEASVSILDKLGFVDSIIFGSKVNNIDKLIDLANTNIENSKNSQIIKKSLKSGMSYSKSISLMYNKTLSPNDILAVEYIAALIRMKSKIKPICIKRVNDIPTASELRKSIINKITINDFSDILNYKLAKYRNGLIDLSNTYLMTNDFSNVLKNIPNKNISFDKISKLLKTKNLTLANIKRILMNVVIGINKDSIKNMKLFPEYVRILAVKKEFLQYIKLIKIPLLLSFAPSSYKSIIKNYKTQNIIKLNKNGTFLLSKSLKNNVFASNLYNMIANSNKLEATTKPIIL